MSTDRKLLRQLKSHYNRLCLELRSHDPHTFSHLQLLDLSISSQITSVSHRNEHICQYLSSEQKPEILHSTTNQEHQRRKSKKFVFAASACATSTPKTSRTLNKISVKPSHTSTPRRSQRHSTPVQPTTLIPLKRLIYKKDSTQHRRRHLYLIDENPQWV